MIRIDRMDFDFTAPEEDFAHRLYADWDGFFHKCVETVVDECLSDYDKDNNVLEIDKLDLDLGTIPEADFYQEFPKRLKAELLKSITEWNLQSEHDNRRTQRQRSENLLCYLEYGHPKPEWADADFNLEDEIEWLYTLPASVQEEFLRRIALLCLRQGQALRRLLWQTASDNLLAAIYTTALNEPLAGLQEKKRLLSVFLEMKPDVPVDFIRETSDDSSLRGMAELLDSHSVRSIMRTETEAHAEVDIPPYWHYQYEWLVRYYPFNGIAIFGSKADLVRHLHYRLLTFIHKRNPSAYLSKASLTVEFLLEVFGATYYKDVLNAIYRLHPCHEDGTPVDDSFFSMELYRTFLRLSLLQPSEEENGKEDAATLEAGEKEYLENGYATEEYLSVLLKDNGQNEVEVRRIVKSLAENKPKALITWMRAEESKDFHSVATLSDYMDNGTVNNLFAVIPFRTLKTVNGIRRALLSHPLYAARLNGMTEALINAAIRKSVLLWIAMGQESLTDGNEDMLLSLIYHEITGDGIMQEYTLDPNGLPNRISVSRQDASSLMQELLQGMARRDYHRAALLSRTVEWMRRNAENYPFLTANGLPLDTALSRALFAYLQDNQAGNSAMTDKDVLENFLRHLQSVITRKGTETGNVQWEQLTEAAFAGNLPDEKHRLKENMEQVLSDQSATLFTLRQSLVHMMERHPDGLLAWMEAEADKSEISRLAEASDGTTVTRWADILSHTAGFACPDAFLQLVEWFMQRMPISQMAEALFRLVKEPGWKSFTADEMEAYFFSRLYGTEEKTADMEALADESLPEDAWKRLFRRYLHFHPKKLLAFIRESVLRNTTALDKWTEWTDTEDWLDLTVAISLSKAELLRQIADSLSLPENERRHALATYIIYGDPEEWPYATPKETVRDFVNAVPSIHNLETGEKEETMRQVEAELKLAEAETQTVDGQPEIFTVNNAGLCLLAPWFVRLFDMLGYLDKEKRQFRNTASKVRTVFLLQYLAYGEERVWREAELAFNRLLTALPGNVPLPRQLHLNEEERQTANSMVQGVKANWPQMNGTSVEGFRGSFLARRGTLELEGEHLMLAVEEKAYDILLETIPWSFRQIRLPWLKKYVQVKWHEKQAF